MIKDSSKPISIAFKNKERPYKTQKNNITDQAISCPIEALFLEKIPNAPKPHPMKAKAFPPPLDLSPLCVPFSPSLQLHSMSCPNESIIDSQNISSTTSSRRSSTILDILRGESYSSQNISSFQEFNFSTPHSDNIASSSGVSSNFINFSDTSDFENDLMFQFDSDTPFKFSNPYT